MLTLLEIYRPTQGLYIHIPHCLQKCHYCDFPTILLDHGPNLDYYTLLIEKELEFCLLQEKEISSIYFGGGTPSLMGTKRIEKILKKISSLGYVLRSNLEVTIEINPGTLTKKDILDLKSTGVNRFSVGIQTFQDKTLKLIGREHSAHESLKTLELIHSADVTFTADLILALPGENFSEFKANVSTLLNFNPHHLSVYVLTVPEKNFLAQNMPKDDLLDELMDHSEELLHQLGYERYEISNYRKKEFAPSLHNLLYWNDLNYWGVGLGAHSYFRNNGDWGLRFWNPKKFSTYEAQILSRKADLSFLSSKQMEALQLNESLTDFCFTHLRQWDGISIADLGSKYPKKIRNLVVENLQILQKDGYIDINNQRWRLSKKGRKFADHVFRKLCFSAKDIEKNMEEFYE